MMFATIFVALCLIIYTPALLVRGFVRFLDRREQRLRNGRPSIRVMASGGRVTFFEVRDPRHPQFRNR
jgi:hypothetical protein